MTKPDPALRTTAIVVVAALIAGLAAGFHVYRSDRKSVIKDAFSVLALYHDLRKSALEDYMRSKGSDVKAAGNSERVQKAILEFTAAWTEFGEDAATQLRRLYIDDNPFGLGQRRNLRRAADDSAYTDLHGDMHDWATRFIEHFGYYDLFLIDKTGNIIYSVEKEEDFGTNLRSGPYAGTPLGFVFQRAMRGSKARIIISDYGFYRPDSETPVLFAGVPLLQDDKKIGVFAVQLPAEPMNAILGFSAGMGRTGETYLVGNDLTMRSQSRFSQEPTLLKTEVDTPAANDGLNGFGGSVIIENYRGRRVLSTYKTIDTGGPPWVLLAEIDEDEVLKRLKKWPIAIKAILAALAAAFLAYLLTRFWELFLAPRFSRD